MPSLHFEHLYPTVRYSDCNRQTDETIDKNSFLPVCLTDRASIRKKLNLKDNPELWNHQVYIIGTRDYYMNVLGLKKVLEYEIVKDLE